MAIKYMKTVNIPDYNSINDLKGWEYEDVLESPGNGDTVIIPDMVNSVNAVLEITAGEGKIQSTKSKLEDVLVDNNVVWIDWVLGSVIATAEDEHTGRVTAIRQVNTSGTTRMLLNA